MPRQAARSGIDDVTDVYLLDPHLPGFSVKVCEGRALEVKAYRGSPGLLEVTGCARGHVESWQKWSFPHGPASLGRQPRVPRSPEPEGDPVTDVERTRPYS